MLCFGRQAGVCSVYNGICAAYVCSMSDAGLDNIPNATEQDRPPITADVIREALPVLSMGGEVPKGVLHICRERGFLTDASKPELSAAGIAHLETESERVLREASVWIRNRPCWDDERGIAPLL